jgi:putative ABC transport system substrate-binding protein
VKLGLVPSINHPGGNMTGVYQLSNALGPKRLDLLSQLVPGPAVIAVLANPTYPTAEAEVDEVRAAARALRRTVDILNAQSERELDVAFAALAAHGAGALLVNADPFFGARREQIVGLAAHHRIPAIYELREFTIAGGLMSYGPSITGAYRLAGAYAAQVLMGEKPADLPVQQSTKVEFIINLKTSKDLGIEIPAKLLALADEVIE